jgi:hypothetical protein
LRADNWSNESVRESPAGKGVSTDAEDIVEIRHQATTGEDTANCEDLPCAVMRSSVCELVRAL